MVTVDMLLLLSWIYYIIGFLIWLLVGFAILRDAKRFKETKGKELIWAFLWWLFTFITLIVYLIVTRTDFINKKKR